MRHFSRRRREEEEESVFVSMTDMTISFLFILMILLAFFALRFTDEEVVPKNQFLRMKNTAEKLQEVNAVLSLRANISPDALSRTIETLKQFQQGASVNDKMWAAEREKFERQLADLQQELVITKAKLQRLQAQQTHADNALEIALASIEMTCPVFQGHL